MPMIAVFETAAALLPFEDEVSERSREHSPEMRLKPSSHMLQSPSTLHAEQPRDLPSSLQQRPPVHRPETQSASAEQLSPSSRRNSQRPPTTSYPALQAVHRPPALQAVHCAVATVELQQRPLAHLPEVQWALMLHVEPGACLR